MAGDPTSTDASFSAEAVESHKSWRDFELNTYISLANRYVYFRVAKAASSTLVHHLARVELAPLGWQVKDVNDKTTVPHLSPFQLPPEMLAQVMTDPGVRKVAFVRNPYSRLLSCYLHRIVAAPDSGSARVFRKGTGTAESSTPSFEEFIEFICTQPSAEMERHWRVQADEVLAPTVEIHFVGHLEHLHEDLVRLSEFLFGSNRFDPEELATINKAPMTTGADEKIASHYDARLAGLVRDRYALDFELFGYSDDPADLLPRG